MRRPAATLHSTEADGGATAAVLSLGEQEHRISYSVDGLTLEPRSEPFLAAALPIAMRRARSMRVEGALSPRLHANLPAIRAVLSDWNDRWRSIDVEVETLESPARRDPPRTASFFSAGVDSFYSVLRQRAAVDALVWVHGFDIPLADTSKRAQVLAGVQAAAERLELPLIVVETDLRAASNGNCGWGMYHGAALASVAHVLSPHFSRILIPATNSHLDLYPWGSHPVLDPLWSSEAVEIVHDGVVVRTEKLSLLAHSDVAMDTLRVCYQQAGEYNCGHCEKCLRTMTTLHLLGALERCRTFPDLLPLEAVRRMPLKNLTELVRARENLVLAERVGADAATIRAIRRLVRTGRLRARVKRAPRDVHMKARTGRRLLRRRVRRRRRPRPQAGA